ncbi:MAG: hypothetical protein Q8R29_00830 [bacterium]|nr:hypothetical protein [bacterium]
MKDIRRYISSHILTALGLILVISAYPTVFSRPSMENLENITGLGAMVLIIGLLVSIVSLTITQILLIKILLSQNSGFLMRNREFMATTVTFCITGYFRKDINFLMLIALVIILVICFINCTKIITKTNEVQK